MRRAAQPNQHQVPQSGRWSFSLMSRTGAAMAPIAAATAFFRQNLQRLLVRGPCSTNAAPLLATTWLLFWVWSNPSSNFNSDNAALPTLTDQQHWLIKALPSLAASAAAPFAGLLTAIWAAAAALSTLQVAVLGAAAAWAIIELAFFLFWFRPMYKQWNVRCNAHQSAAAQGTAECYALFKRFMAFSSSAPCQLDFLYAYLSTWFRGAAPQDIKRENMEELFAYGFFYRTRKQLDALGLGHLPSEMTSEFENCFNFKFPPGYNPNLQYMSHLWEDLRVSWRPLAFYAVMEALAFVAACAMWMMGFKRQQLGGMRYYTRGISEDTSRCRQQQQQQPVVFIHGVAGLLPYLPLLMRLAALQAPLLVMDMKHVGLRLSCSIPTVDSLAAALAAALQHHALPPALVVAHSYGTLVAGRLLRLKRSAVASVLFVDPVCFAMFMPRLLHGFIYAALTVEWSKPLAAAFNLLLWLVSKDLHVAATFMRNFYWSDLNLWPEDLPEGSCVVLSGDDALVSSEEIGIMLSSNPHIQVLFKPGLIHGGFMLDHATRSEVLTTVRSLASAVLATTTGADPAAAAVTPSAADVAAVLVDATPAPLDDQMAAARADCSRSPFVPTLDKPDEPDYIDQIFRHHLPAVRELSASRSSSCSSCGCDLITSDQDVQGSDNQPDQAPPKIPRRHTFDLVANSANYTWHNHGSSSDGSDAEGDVASAAAAAAATVVATAAANGAAAAAALLVAATQPAGLLSASCSHCCRQCWEEQTVQQRRHLTPTPVVERRYTVH